MPAMHGAIQARISLNAFGLRSGIDMVNSVRALHAAPIFDGLASWFRQLRDAREACGDPSLISLSAFSIMSGIVMVINDRAAHAVPIFNGLASCIVTQGTFEMPEMHVAILVVISLSAFGITSGIVGARSDRTSHDVPTFVGLASDVRSIVDLRDARDA
jgi:hypothetical protein